MDSGVDPRGLYLKAIWILDMKTVSSHILVMVVQTGDAGLGNLEEVQVPGVGTLLSLCDPRLGGEDEIEFAKHWRSVWTWVMSL